MALIEDVIAELQRVILAHPDHLRVFRHEQRNFEGWFCGELTKILYDMQAMNPSVNFLAGRKQQGAIIDFRVERPPEHIAIEVKAWPMRRGSLLVPSFYLGRQAKDPKPGQKPGLEKDASALKDWVARTPTATGAYILAVCYDRPTTKLWRSGLRSYAGFLPQFPVRPRTRPGAYPPEFFIGVLQLK